MASTAYSFTVEATDAAGTSAASGAVNVTTLANSGGTCATAWNATTIYNTGNTASVGGENYVANFWTQNQNPATNNGGAGSGRTLDCNWSMFHMLGSAGCANGIGGVRNHAIQHELELERGYSTGRMQRQLQSPAKQRFNSVPNHNVRCGNRPHTIHNLWLQCGSDGFGRHLSGEFNAKCDNPGELVLNQTKHSNRIGGFGNNRFQHQPELTAVTPPSGCTITNYTVLQNGTAVGTTTRTSYTAANLSPSTTYTYTVEASDFAGHPPRVRPSR